MLDELAVLQRQAHAEAARGRVDEAIETLLTAAQHTHAGEHDYLAVLRSLEELFTRRGSTREALTVVAYLASHDASAWTRADSMLSRVPPVDRAMAAAARGHWLQAATEMESAGRLGAAAIFRERALEWPEARSLWSRLARTAENTDAYVAALVRFNLARCARRAGDAGQAREAMVASVGLLEEAADHFESMGQRERAFDCFQVLIEIGRDGGAFEDALEGYVNCIRILREDHLTHFALEHFDAAMTTAAECGETSAAATFAGEAAAYARSLGLAPAAATLTMRQGDLWLSASKQHARRGAPVEIIAHALLAAILAFGQAGQYRRVGQLYTELALLELDARRRAHYALAARRYVDACDEAIDVPDAEVRMRRPDEGLGQVWHTDVIEWEQQGSAAEACADVMLDGRWLDLIRRKAMLARLAALRAGDNDTGDLVGARVHLCERLGALQNYAVMSPLEKLFLRPEVPVKIAVLQAVETLFFKRSFVIVRAGLRDTDVAVATKAMHALAALRFAHAFDPLARIYQESSVSAVRAAAAVALSYIDTIEAGEFLLGVLEHGAPSDGMAVLGALRNSNGARFVQLAREAIKHAREPVRTSLRELLVHGGHAL